MVLMTVMDTGSLDVVGGVEVGVGVGAGIKDASEGGRVVWPELSTAQIPSMTVISSPLLR